MECVYSRAHAKVLTKHFTHTKLCTGLQIISSLKSTRVQLSNIFMHFDKNDFFGELEAKRQHK